MSAEIAGIYEPCPTGTDVAARVEHALGHGHEPTVRTLGALTVGWAGAAAAREREGEPLELRAGFRRAVWNAGTQRGLLTRDPLGLGGLYYCATGGRLAFATEIRALLRLLPARPAPDEIALVHWLANGTELPGRTFYQGIARLPAGCRLVLDAGWRSESHWMPRYSAPLRVDPGEAARLLRDEVASSVREAAGAGSVGVLLSGGFDSGYVASLAAAEGLAPRGYSAVFPDHPSVDESHLVERLAGELGIGVHPLPVGAASPFPAAFEYLARWQMPLPSMGHFYARELLRRAVDDGVDVVLDGEGGDELFGREPYLIADLLRRGRPAAALSFSRSLASPGYPWWRVLADSGLRPALPYGFHRVLRRRHSEAGRAPGWLNDQSARLLAQVEDPWAWKRIDAPRWWAHRLHRLVDGAEELGVGDYLRRRAAEAGVAVAHPLLSPALIELALSLPPELALRAGDERGIARLSAQGVMPDGARLRMEKSYFNELYNDCLTGELDFLRDLLLGPRSELRAYVRAEVVRTLLDRPPARERRPFSGWAPLVWRLASIETWLRAQADTEYPERAGTLPGAVTGSIR